MIHWKHILAFIPIVKEADTIFGYKQTCIHHMTATSYLGELRRLILHVTFNDFCLASGTMDSKMTLETSIEFHRYQAYITDKRCILDWVDWICVSYKIVQDFYLGCTSYKQEKIYQHIKSYKHPLIILHIGSKHGWYLRSLLKAWLMFLCYVDHTFCCTIVCHKR